MHAKTMIGISELKGLWRRSLIRLPDGACDTTTQVHWLQSERYFGDLRRPQPMADFSHARCLRDLSSEDCVKLAEQQGFAGHLTFDGNHFEWGRMIDFQPQGAFADIGSLHFENQVLIEKGRDADYLEHWHRDAAEATSPAGALLLREARLGTAALLIGVGEHYIFARARAVALPPHTSLRECMLAAGSLEEAHALLDCEISLCSLTPEGPAVSSSTLPFRVGQLLRAGLSGSWQIMDGEGDCAAMKRYLALGET
jgi:hypothetical protein